VESNGGVIGTAGWAWWAAYGVNTQEAVDADLAAWNPYVGKITFSTRLSGETSSITAYHTATAVPEPGTLLLLGSGLLCLVAVGRKKFRK
jgi:hypothetical protein